MAKSRRIAWGGTTVLALAFAASSGLALNFPAPDGGRWTAKTGTSNAGPPEAIEIPVALLVDVNSGSTLYESAATRRFPPASMAKVMTLYVAFEEIAAGRLDPTRTFTVANATAREWNGRGTSLYLKGGREIDADTLLRGIATISANDASVVLAEGYAGDVATWCRLMNDHARRLGMTNSNFATPSGWPDGGKTYVTAHDLAKLAEALVVRHPELYRRYFGQKRMIFDGVEQQSHDPTIGVVRGADGIKTGHTNEAGYNFLGSAQRDGRRLIMVIGGAQSEAERAAASRALLEWGFAEFRSRPLFAAGKRIASARVQDGAARSVPLVADRAITAVHRAHKSASVSLQVSYQGPLVAPIAKGAQVAGLEIRTGNAPPSHIPLYAAVSVEKAGPIDRLINGLIGLVS